jgi:hypothetical protein
MAWTEYYVDPASGSDSTGTGGIGSPWATVQHALDTVTPSGRDRINLKAGAVDSYTNYLDFSTFAPSNTGNNVLIQGYTSAAGDGGLGQITGSNGLINEAGRSGIHLVNLDLNISNIGATFIGIKIGNESSIIGCHINCSMAANSEAVSLYNRSYFMDNYYECSNAKGRVVANQIYRNVIKQNNPSGSNSSLISNGFATFNIVWNKLADAGHGIFCQDASLCAHNTVFSEGASTGIGIYAYGQRMTVFNNYIEGFSGTGGLGVSTGGRVYVTGNAFYNCTTDISSGDQAYEGDNLFLSASALSDPTNGDFNVDATVKGDAFDSGGVFRGIATTKCELNYGASISQTAASVGGGSSSTPTAGTQIYPFRQFVSDKFGAVLHPLRSN